MTWIVKDHYKGKVYLRTNNQQYAVDFANYYNKRKKVPFTKILISYGSSMFTHSTDYDINKQFGVRDLFALYPSKYESPFVKNNKHYSRMHTLYLKRKYDLIIRLCRKYHLWPYCARDGHKMCGFDW